MNIQLSNEDEILYQEGTKITGNEKVIRVEVIVGATCHFISDNYFKVSTEGLVLLQDNIEAINAFSKNGYREEIVVNEWPKAEKVPDWIYFCKKTKQISFKELETHYVEVAPRIELNLLSAFNAKYPEFYKNFPNVIQRKDSKGKFCYAVFRQWVRKSYVRVYQNVYGLDVNWWFACASK
jgi:hypothetical protein